MENLSTKGLIKKEEGVSWVMIFISILLLVAYILSGKMVERSWNYLVVASDKIANNTWDALIDSHCQRYEDPRCQKYYYDQFCLKKYEFFCKKSREIIIPLGRSRE